MQTENAQIKEKFQEINGKYQAELKFKNDLIQEVLQKQQELEELKTSIVTQKEDFEKYQKKTEKVISEQKLKMNQEKALIETDRKLLFEKLDTDKLDRSVLSLTESVDDQNDSDKSFV